MLKPNLGKLGSSLRELGSMRPAGCPLSVEFGVGSLKVLQLAPGDSPSIVAAAQLDTRTTCSTTRPSGWRSRSRRCPN
jgi:hypothetical protein